MSSWERGVRSNWRKSCAHPGQKWWGPFSCPWEKSDLEYWAPRLTSNASLCLHSLCPSAAPHTHWLPLEKHRFSPEVLQRLIHPGLIHRGQAWFSPVNCSAIGSPSGSRALTFSEVILLSRFLLCKTCSKQQCNALCWLRQCLQDAQSGSKIYSCLNSHVLLL